MTSTPAYGFRIKKGAAGPMQAAIQAGDVGSIQQLLASRFPGLKFESLDAGAEEVEKPEEATTTPTVPAREVAKEETTASLFEDYMANLPAVTRPLVTTDYKGVRGGRLGEGNYTTASLIPGAQAASPAVPAPTTPSTSEPTTAAPSYTYTTYNYYDMPQAVQQETPTTEPTGGAPSTTDQTVARGLTPAWAKTTSQQPTTASQAAAGLVPSTTQRGVYVAPTSPEASKAAAGAAERIATRQAEQPGNIGARAAAGSDKQMGAQAAAALIAAPGSDRKAAEAALKQAEKGNIELTNQARKALEQAAEKKKK